MLKPKSYEVQMIQHSFAISTTREFTPTLLVASYSLTPSKS